MTGVGLKHARFDKLRVLRIGWSVTDECLMNIGALTSLEWLMVSGPSIADTGVQELSRLKNLQVLLLWGGGKMTGVAMKHLAGLNKLRHLDVRSGPGVTDAGLKEIAALTSLESLDLRRSKITDAGVKELSGLKALRGLYLVETSVTDQAIEHIAKISNLQEVGLSQNKRDKGGQGKTLRTSSWLDCWALARPASMR